MFDTLKGWIEHIALNSIIPGLAQPISWRASHQKPTFPPKYNYLHLQHYIHPFSWTTEYGPTDFISNKYLRAWRPHKFLAAFHFIPNLRPPAVTSLANAVFVRRKTYLHLSQEKKRPRPPLYCHFLSYLSQLS